MIESIIKIEWKRKLLHPTLAALLTMLTLQPLAVLAEDTDVFLGAPDGGDNTAKPNVLFILDTSGSMGSTSGTGVTGLTRIDALKNSLNGLLNSVNDINVGLMSFNTRGGPVRYPVSYLDDPIEKVEAGGFLLSIPVATANDDAEETVAPALGPNLGKVDLSSIALHLSEKGDWTTIESTMAGSADDGHAIIPGGNYVDNWNSLYLSLDRKLALRFRNINIPPNVTITDARIVFHIDPDDTNTENYPGGPDEFSAAAANITTHYVPSAPALSGDISLLPPGPTTHFWNDIPSKQSGAELQTSNFAPLIQEIVSRSAPDNWSSGNDIALFLQGTQGFRDLASYAASGQGAEYRPKLLISYVDSPVLESQMVALRFQDVKIPQGAKIYNAKIDFKASGNADKKITYRIKVERAVDSQAFSTTAKDLSSRAKTSSVNWKLSNNAADEWTDGERYQTSNFASLLQEIVNQPGADGWCGGNAVTVFLESVNISNRRITAFEGVSTSIDEAPTLKIDFDTDSSNISSPHTGCSASVISSRISRGNRDVEEQKSNGDLKKHSYTLDMGQRHIGLRFLNINLPQGSSISNAYIEFVSNNTVSTSTNLTITGHDNNNSSNFSDNSAVSNRVSGSGTGNTVPWSPGGWTDGETYKTDDISSIIKEIIDRPGWVLGNNLSLMITGSGERDAISFNSNPLKAPRLVIEARSNLAGTITLSGQTVRDRLIEEINGLELVSGTPIVDTYLEAVRYYRSMDALWGLKRGAQYFNDRNGRVSHPLTYTGGTVNQPGACNNSDLNNYDCIWEKVSVGANYTSPILDECQPNYIIVISDGIQNTFTRTGDEAIEALIGQSCSSNSGGAECGTKLATYVSTNDQADGTGDTPNRAGIQTIKTHTIGFTLGDGPNAQFLKDLAAAGGGGFHDASSASALIEIMQTILSEILSEPTTFVAPTLTLNAFNQLFDSNEIYISLFEPEDSTRWSGNLKRYKLCTPEQDKNKECDVNDMLDTNDNQATENGKISDNALSVWSDGADGADGSTVEKGGAGEQVVKQGHANRRVYTYTGAVAPNNVALTAHPLTDSNVNLTFNFFGVPDGDEDELINWIRGQDVDDDNADADTNDTRWIFGDPLHSGATPIKYGITDTEAIVKLVLGTNDGSIRMLNSKTGQEEWAFYPQSMLRKQKALRDDLGGDHIYGVDGSPEVWIHDHDNNGSIGSSPDFVYAYIGERRGGSNYYALDISPSSAITNVNSLNEIHPKLMWRIEGDSGDFARLGQTWSKPQRTRLQMTVGTDIEIKDVLIFGGGYDTGNDSNYGPASNKGNAIFVVDALTGQRLWWASSDPSADVVVPDMKYAIPSDVRLLDTKSDGSADRIYVGDEGGQIWRVDFESTFVGNSSAGTIVGKTAELSDNSGTPAAIPDQRRFLFKPAVALVNDAANTETGKSKFIAIAIASGNRADPLNKTVLDKAYVLRDTQIDPMPTSGGGLASNSYKTIKGLAGDIYDATADIATNITPPAGLKDSRGWSIDLISSANTLEGEKSITEGLIVIPAISGAYPFYTFNTYVPANTGTGSACSASTGTNYIYTVNLLNANALDGSRATINNTGGIASSSILISQDGQGGYDPTDPSSGGDGDTTSMSGTAKGPPRNRGTYSTVYWLD